MATPAHKIDEQNEVQPVTVAADCLRQANGDLRQAALMMQQRVQNSRKLRDQVLAPFMKQAIWYFVRQAMGRSRRNYPLGVPAPANDNTDGIGRVSQRNWYEYPLPGGLPLGRATRDDLLDAIAHHEQQAESNARKARWLELVLAAMPQRSRKTVAEKLSQQQLDAIASEVG